SGVYFQKVTSTTLRFVPYRAGSSDIMKDLVGGHIDMTFDQAISALPYVRSGDVKAYAVTADQRLGVAPDVPPIDEAAVRERHDFTWAWLLGPEGTPKEAGRN